MASVQSKARQTDGQRETERDRDRTERQRQTQTEIEIYVDKLEDGGARETITCFWSPPWQVCRARLDHQANTPR